MRNRWKFALVIAAALASTSAAAQEIRGNAPNGTQQRDGGGLELIWNLIGLAGLIGLTGLWRSSDNDGYTDDPIEP